jgi:hypothetical protein
MTYGRWPAIIAPEFSRLLKVSIMSASRALKDVLHPCDPVGLALALRDRKRQFWRAAQPGVCASLLPWPILNGLVTMQAIQSGQVRVMQRNRDLPLEMFTQPPAYPNSARSLLPNAVMAATKRGVSLAVNGIHEHVPALAAMMAMLERHLRRNIRANAYLSYHHDSAFGAHYDSHDVLVFQIHGRKRWWCHGQVDAFPLRNRAFSSPK